MPKILYILGSGSLSLFILSGCIKPRQDNPAPSPLSTCQSTTTKTDIYIAGATSSEPEQKVMRQVLDGLARLDSRQITIDRVTGDQLNTIYSNRHDRRAIQQVAKQWTIVPVTEKGIVAPFERIHAIGHSNDDIGIFSKVYIFTAGTSNPDTLEKIRTAATTLQGYSCLQVNVIGLDSANRLKMSEALNPINTKLRFASRDRQEWQQLID